MPHSLLGNAGGWGGGGEGAVGSQAKPATHLRYKGHFAAAQQRRSVCICTACQCQNLFMKDFETISVAMSAT